MTSDALAEEDEHRPTAVMNNVIAITPAAAVKEHSRFVRRTLRYLGIAEPDLPDVAQEVFVVIYRKLQSFEGRSALRSWVYRICQRAAADHRRRAYVRREVIAEIPVEEKAATHWIDGVAVIEARNSLRFALGTLDELRRFILVRHDIEGVRMREIAATLKCPLQTGYTRLRAARRAVTDAVESTTAVATHVNVANECAPAMGRSS